VAYSRTDQAPDRGGDIGSITRTTLYGSRTLLGKTYRMWVPEEREAYLTAYEASIAGRPLESLTADEIAERSDVTAARLGLAPEESSLRAMLDSAGVDLDDPTIRTYIAERQAALDAGVVPLSQLQQEVQALALNPKFTKPATVYQQELELSGFGDDPFYAPKPVATDPAAGITRPGMGQFVQADPSAPDYQEAEGTGYIRYANGVLVSPEGGVTFDPTSNAPGSIRWFRETVNGWDEEKVKDWRGKLHEWGYLAEDETKSGSADLNFREALARYHGARYVNGGTPVVEDATMAAGGSTAPKPVNLRDFSAQIRNDVRDQYETVYGVAPSDGEVELWSDYIIRQGMQLQRKFRRKYDDPMTSMASVEAEEMFAEKIETSPKAEFLHEAEEENTRLRETFDRMAQVTASLAR
jgi:hypothetical protein